MSTSQASINDLPEETLHKIYAFIDSLPFLLEIATVNKLHNRMMRSGSWRHLKVFLTDNDIFERTLTQYRFVNLIIDDTVSEAKLKQHSRLLHRCEKLKIYGHSLNEIVPYLKNCRKLYAISSELSDESASYLSNCKRLKFRNTVITTQLKEFKSCKYLRLNKTKTKYNDVKSFVDLFDGPDDDRYCRSFESKNNYLAGETCELLWKIPEVNLDMNKVPLSDEDIENLRYCSKLDISFSYITNQGFKQIAYGDECRTINLSGVEITDYWDDDLFEKFNYIKLGHAQHFPLSFIPSLSGVRKLDLIGIWVESEELHYFTNCVKLKLWCGRDGEVFNDDDISTLKKVKSLTLYNAKLSMNAINALTSCKKLELMSSNITGDHTGLLRLNRLVIRHTHNIPIDYLAKRGLNIKIKKSLY